MKLHEFQAKQVLAGAGIAIPEGRVATTPAEAEGAATALGLPVVVKAQVHVGGRGKAGGVKLAKTAAEARRYADDILGMDINGFTVGKVYVERAAKVAQELYLGVTIDRDRRRPVVMLSTVGGMDIEEAAVTDRSSVRGLLNCISAWTVRAFAAAISRQVTARSSARRAGWNIGAVVEAFGMTESASFANGCSRP